MLNQGYGTAAATLIHQGLTAALPGLHKVGYRTQQKGWMLRPFGRTASSFKVKKQPRWRTADQNAIHQLTDTETVIAFGPYSPGRLIMRRAALLIANRGAAKQSPHSAAEIAWTLRVLAVTWVKPRATKTCLECHYRMQSASQYHFTRVLSPERCTS